MTWEVSVAILVAALIYVVYKASSEIDEVHWPLKVGLFHAALILGVAAVALADAIATANTAAAAVTGVLGAIYRAGIIVLLLSFAYWIVRMLHWYFTKAMEQGGMAKNEDNERGF